MNNSKKDTLRASQRVSVGSKLATETLDGTTTTETLQFAGAMSKVTFQATGTLLGTVEFSVNGANWFSSAAIAAANAPATFSTHNFNSMRVTRTSGTGTLVVAATV